MFQIHEIGLLRPFLPRASFRQSQNLFSFKFPIFDFRQRFGRKSTQKSDPNAVGNRENRKTVGRSGSLSLHGLDPLVRIWVCTV